MEIELTNWSGKRVGGFISWLAMPGRPQRGAARSDGQRWVAPHGGDCLKLDSHCSVDSVNLRCLIAKLHRVGTANSLLKSEIRKDESCRSIVGLQI